MGVDMRDLQRDLQTGLKTGFCGAWHNGVRRRIWTQSKEGDRCPLGKNQFLRTLLEKKPGIYVGNFCENKCRFKQQNMRKYLIF
jgi:hypothetical protein